MATISFSTMGASQVELPLRQFDAEEYLAMAEAGVFEARRRVELIGGYIVDMSPAGPDHNFVVMRFPRLFATVMPQFEFWVQGTLRIDRTHVLDPDFMLLRARQESYRDAHPTAADVALLIEVAASSLGRDAAVKMPIYAAAGITDYWIADVDRDVLIMHRQPAGNRYKDIQEYSGNAAVNALATPGLTIQVAQIFH
jgi:Uma2 family endonuclease